MILIHPEMTKEDMLKLLKTREISISGLQTMCRYCKISDLGLKPEPIKKRLLEHLDGVEVLAGAEVRGGIHLFGGMGS